MIFYTIIGLRELQAKLQRIPPDVQNRLRPFMASATIVLRNMVKGNIELRFRSIGDLYKSVRSSMTERPGAITGRVYTQGIPYAAIQEYGGETRPHDILPVHGKALAFQMRGGGYAGGIGSDWRRGFGRGSFETALTIVRKVKHPGSRIPQRSYAQLALFQYRVPFQDGIRQVVDGATK